MYEFFLVIPQQKVLSEGKVDYRWQHPASRRNNAIPMGTSQRILINGQVFLSPLPSLFQKSEGEERGIPLFGGIGGRRVFFDQGEVFIDFFEWTAHPVPSL